MKKKVKINFPKDFIDMHDGVPIHDKTINEWIKKMLDDMKKTNEPFGYILCGNTFVSVFNTHDYYEVYVTRNYFSMDIEK